MSNPSIVKIYNFTGRLVFQSNWNKTSLINISEYNPGVYLYVLGNEGTVFDPSMGISL
ncbi:MAG: T9SS type A sorting domain-containing protein [Crocinitomicaceae bacterium]|nr:T9SS type A sorting domain-containing protein [Crocinitomicaceae bacterium]